MTYLEAKNLVQLERFEITWENANPYENQCDEERCVNGQNCEICNKNDGYDEPLNH